MPRKSSKGTKTSPKAESRLEIPRLLTVQHLADLLGLTGVEVIKHLMQNGVMANLNQTIDFDTAAVVASDLGYEPVEMAMPEPTGFTREVVDGQELHPRPAVVTVMGHIDHGKTRLLDAIRQTNVMDTEAGSITQHIGAYQAEVDGRKITFLDTPGHEAFTAMRARGAKVTDIAVLVVAADDGVMPQTREAIAHARAAGVPIVVAINKIDKAGANLDRVKQQLAEEGLLIEEWGGDTICVPVSAKMKQNVSELLENILIVAEMLELKAPVDCLASGVVIEAELDKSKGPLATVLVQSGTLKLGDPVVVGDTWGKVKAMFNDAGKRVKKAEPATPVKILGLNGVPQAGDPCTAVASEKEARSWVQKRQQERQLESLRPARTLTLDRLLADTEEGQPKQLSLILKTDVQGSIEPIRTSLEQLETEDTKVRIIHAGSGGITEGDVLLALASKAIIIGFDTAPTPGAQSLAQLEGVDIRRYSVIYDLVDDIQRAIKGMKEPSYAEVIQGHAEVRAVFSSSKYGKAAGVYVTDGKLRRDDMVRVLRRGEVVYEGTLASLRRFKDDVKEVTAGYECGVGVSGFKAFQEGDTIEDYRMERVDESET
ncbi:MAG: translation initiation factor IF-2 [Chloroflexi bacterium]|nr:MAG: translation initiation factor IF-2 [Chloroflexota bacterium]RLC96720.1 MAG: translation initiation factor IF-2 [Chloroflexota bacterium]